MNDSFQYRLTKDKKSEIAQNLIDILQKDANITEQTRKFIYDWITTGAEGKTKAFFDVWDIVLKNYLPTTRPILFRACERISKKGKIASFTGRLECTRKISKGRGSIIICDTKEQLEFDKEFSKAGEYKHTFYPLVSILIKARDSGGCGFSESFLNDYIGEDEYIMRINLGNMYSFRWMKNE
ncbi:hypothetical protein CLU83_1974 [Flavobacterium sp. 1]|uniref:hypothetical protein n=1 Tax=Flavobacterium sp. 1 TaxID=2035200 RepID=UPI000CA7B123|nr:hypothetical protein [Flavobacterium sp. 1]PJJ08687.1 hypothetical protein CLU83_1974 [Flavobacterium sp. 1]